MSPRFDARVYITIKREVADPQGQAVVEAVNHWLESQSAAGSLAKARVGKVVELSVVAPDAAAAEALLTKVADRVLANPNTEEYEIRVDGAARG
ncbi:MAG: phosphoribosylformylglycinamidine synthase subunit PurS [Candidatus Sumerlaeia bacterium]|nr:phosphoribosylformylglycinamidine synthase subunit PurS [Candidatus Sumerlaeia bacterium]